MGKRTNRVLGFISTGTLRAMASVLERLGIADRLRTSIECELLVRGLEESAASEDEQPGMLP